MKISPNTLRSWIPAIGSIFEHFGLIVFLTLFITPFGVFIGGDPFFFNVYKGELAIYFPFFGIGVFLIFFGKFLNKTLAPPTSKCVLFLILFLIQLFALSFFSHDSAISHLFIPLWATALLAVAFGSRLYTLSRPYLCLLFFSILLAYVVHHISPNWVVSPDMIGVSALIAALIIRMHHAITGKLYIILVLFWIIFESSNILFLLATLIIWALQTAQMQRFEKKEWSTLIPPMFLLFLIISSYILLPLRTPFVWEGISNFNQLIYGVGEGQFLIMKSILADFFLNPEHLQTPSSGLVTVFYEKGIIGVLFILGLLMVPIINHGKSMIWWSIAFFLIFLTSRDALTTENGILFCLPFLLMVAKKQKDPEYVSK